MTAHIMQHSTEAWPMTPSTWVSATACGGSGSTWSKRMANASNDSWEVRAFAEDASSSGQWPPRSYSCSFCQREFRTAQALGGHMNVHRRERAHANQLASLRAASARLTSTVELLSPISMSVSGSVALNSGSASTTPLSSSPISQESISSSSELPLLPNTTTLPTWAPSSRGAGFSYHPYEKTSPRHTQAGARFSFCLNKVMNEHEDTLDLELRLGRSSCAV